MSKQIVTTSIQRPELLSVSEFSRKFHISRPKIYALIDQKMLNTEVICNTFYINISNRAVINRAMEYKTENPGQWSRSHDYKMPIMKGSEQDIEFEKGWRKDMGMD